MTVPLPSSFQASRAILFPRYRLSFGTFLALGIVTAAATITILFNCIACFYRPLMYLFFIVCCLLLLMHYSAVSPAHCYLGLDSGPCPLRGVNADTIIINYTGM